jgi:hypothetical protein
MIVQINTDYDMGKIVRLSCSAFADRESALGALLIRADELGATPRTNGFHFSHNARKITLTAERHPSEN